MSSRVVSNNVKAGVFMLGGLAGGFAILVALANGLDLLKSKNEYVVRFTLKNGANGLKKDSSVRIGGQEVGKVIGVGYEWAAPPTGDLAKTIPAGTRIPAAILVKLGLQSDIAIFKNAKFQLEQPLLGSVSVINVTDVGTPDAGLLPPGSQIAAGLAPGLLAQAGLGQDEIDQFKDVLRNVHTVTKGVADDYEQVWREKLNKIVTDTGKAVAEVREAIEEYRPKIKEGVDRVPKITEDVQNFVDKANAFGDQAKKMGADIQAFIDRNAPKGDQIVEDTRATIEDIRKVGYPKVVSAVDDAKEALQGFKTAGNKTAEFVERALSLLAEQSPEIRQLLANMRLASDQLKLTLTDVRRSPWKLLYQPARKEVQQDLLFMSARTYAEAVSDLRAATASLESVVKASEALNRPADAADMARIREQIARAFAKYDEAERDLLKRLSSEPEQK